jgi:2-octaprenyl-6-methoxyphenol hydroxylase
VQTVSTDPHPTFPLRGGRSFTESSDMKMDYDIVIVGGGMVGASLACALRDTGLRIAVVEAVPLKSDTQPSYNERTVALAYGSRRIFEGMAVWREIERLGATPIEHIHVSHRGRFGVTRLDAKGIGLPALGYVVENRVLGAALLKSVEGANNLTWYCPATVEEFQVESDAAVVRIKQGNETISLKTRLIVGADGAQSAVRRLADIDAERTEYAQVAVVATVAPGRPHDNTAYERFTDSGPLALLPMRDNRCAVVWSAKAHDAETIVGWSDNEYLQQLQERFGDRLGRFSRPGARTRYPLALTRVSEYVQPRLALIGNAAHTVHPVAGQGFNLGLRDVAVLAEVTLAAIRAGEDIGGVAVLQRYADWRRRDTRTTEVFTDGLIRIFSNEFTPLALARGLGLVTVDLLPAVKRRLVRMTSGLAGRLPRLARGLSLERLSK